MAHRGRGIQSIEVSGRILRALVDANEPMMLKDLAQVAELAPAQCHAYLTSLRHVGLVHQDPMSGLYRTGPFAMRLGISWLKSNPLASSTIHELKALTDELGVMTLLVVWGVSGPSIIHLNAGITPTAMNIRQGTLFSVTGTASGRLFSAFGSPDHLEQQIASDLDQSVRSGHIGASVTREEFDQKVEATRKCGYAIAEGTPIPDINAAAAPVFDADGVMRFAATLIGPANELDVKKGSLAVDRLLNTAKKLSNASEGPHTAATSISPRETTAKSGTAKTKA